LRVKGSYTPQKCERVNKIMGNQEFDIIFRGDIVFGHQLADVKLRLQQLFKADAAKVDALFSGRPVPLKRGLDQASAEKYKEALTRAGAQVDIVAAGETKSASAPVARPVPTPPVSTPVLAAAPLTLAQRLELQAAADKEAAEKATLKREQGEREQAARDAAQGVKPSTAPSSWSLAPVGSYMLQPTEHAIAEPAAIDTSTMSLRPAEAGNILDANEQPPEPVATVIAPNFDVAEAGADLVRADEKMDLPLLEIELEDWGLADLGEDLISATEKPQIAIPVIHIPDVGLAPAGADLGQLKPQVKAVVPDVSGIRLAD
jgi:hypothetical protein